MLKFIPRTAGLLIFFLISCSHHSHQNIQTTSTPQPAATLQKSKNPPKAPFMPAPLFLALLPVSMPLLFIHNANKVDKKIKTPPTNKTGKNTNTP